MKLIILLLSSVSILVFLLGLFQSEVINGVRTYVQGEGLWAKAEKDSVMLLHRYVDTNDEAIYREFSRSLSVNLGDRRARLALQQTPPDLAAARAGFLAGGNHPDDIDSLISFFLYFQDVSYMREAIAIWTEADEEIARLQQLGEFAFQAHQRGDDDMLQLLQQRVNELNSKLNRLEIDFSGVLSDGSRWVKQVTLYVSVFSMVFLIGIALYISRRITQRLNDTEVQLRFSQNRLNSLLQSELLGILDWDANGGVLDANDVFLNMLGYSREELNSGCLNWRNITPEEFHDADAAAMMQIEREGYCTPFEKEFIHKEGHRVPVYVGGALFDGHSDQGIAFVLDQTLKKEVEQQLRLSASVLEGSRDAIVITDGHGQVIRVNQAYCDLTGLAKESLLGRRLDSLFTANGATISELLQTKGYWQGDAELLKRQEQSVPVLGSINSVASDAGDLLYYVAIFVDISERVVQERKLWDLARYDHLTGLVNKHFYSELVTKALERAKASGNRCAFFFIDLDKFKPVNDSYGHHVGDQLLAAVAERLTTTVRSHDIVSRHGGDEFSIIVEDVGSKENAAMIARKIIDNVQKPFHIEGRQIHVSCSVGISLYPDHGHNASGLIRAADQAMYEAKSSAADGYQIYQLM
ncbi:diguanylate cyclase domain-containing protein [Shewanella cyperi]|uniref:diguanylate cyclase domain-containing protein n=1 Tax=Shewanella cyperi TaxID=2814292 RepID=UPI001A93DF13|nr:diguanylate cyclase [Shewanella cyperi]QSX41225.1 diguanylate cyclase [Shewanella cyperi]